MESRDSVFSQDMYGRDIERSCECLVGRYGPVELQVVVLWREAVDIDRNIRENGSRKNRPILQHGTVQKRFEDTSRAAGRLEYVHLASWTAGRETGVAAVCQYFHCPDIEHDGGDVIDAPAAEDAVPSSGDGLHLPLQIDVHRGPAASVSGIVEESAVCQVGCVLWQWQRFVRQGLIASKSQVCRVYLPRVIQRTEQPVPFLFQHVAVSARMYHGRGVGQYCECGCLGPG